MTAKPTHGGDRQVAGRPNKYGEPTVKKKLPNPSIENSRGGSLTE